MVARSYFVSWRFCYLAAVLLMSGLGSMPQGNPAYSQTTPAAGKTPRAKQAIPNAAELKAVQLKIQEVYGAEIQAADKPAEKEALAVKLLKMAHESHDDPVTFYALVNMIRELSNGSGNFAASLTLTKKLIEFFELDSTEEHYQTLKKYSESPAANPAGLQEAATVSFQMAEEFSKKGDSEQALRFSRIAHATATKARSAPLLKQITALGTELAARETERKALPAAEQKLAEDPTDPTANMTVGRWYWFRMDDPNKAMPYLAKTVDSPLKKAAHAELEKPATPGTQVELADQWWALAQVVKEEALKNRVLTRAGEWYQTALPESKGFDKIKAERRLAEIQTLLGSKKIVPVKTAVEPAKDVATTTAPATHLPANTPSALPPVGDLPKSVKTSLGAELILIPAGKFLIGSPENEPNHRSNENQLPVQITRAFYMGKCEVTQGEWKELMGTEPWKDKITQKPLDFVKEGDDIAAIYITHGLGFQGQIEPDSAVAFCKKLSQKEGRNYRLPTEAEWEYACRAGTETAYSFGNDAAVLRDYAWYQKNSKNRPQQVGVKKPNPWGLYDMYGNATEWCLDSFISNQQKYIVVGPGMAGNPMSRTDSRAYRGGGYGTDAEFCRSATRGGGTYNNKGCTNGFRLVLEADKFVNSPVPAPPTKLTVKEPPKTLKIGTGAELLYIPAGKFKMGSPLKVEGQDLSEKQVDVEISRGFYLGKYEVTQGEWKALMGTEPWLREGKAMDAVKLGDDYPAVHIRHGHNTDGPTIHPDSALAFLQKLSLKDGRSYRLPTEAEWEYACRAGTTSEYSFGDDATKLTEYGWWGGEWKRGNVKTARHAREVGKLLPNPWGLYDMHGNVAEWCLDGASDNLLGGRDPVGPKSSPNRSARGGGWYDEPLILRSAARRRSSLGNGNSNVGFRIAATAP